MDRISHFFKMYSKVIITLLLMIILLKQCSIESRLSKNIRVNQEIIKSIEIKDSLYKTNLDIINHKLDSTLISNSAVINSNRTTTSAINNQKQVVVKVIPQQIKE